MENTVGAPSICKVILLGQVQYEQWPHVLQAVDDVRAYCPGLHVMHSDCALVLDTLEKVPAGHPMQLPSPSEDQKPAGQGRHAVAPYVLT